MSSDKFIDLRSQIYTYSNCPQGTDNGMLQNNFNFLSHIPTKENLALQHPVL